MEPELSSAPEDELEVERPSVTDGDSMSSWSDSRLIRKCLDGDEQAWAALINKYKRLIYSIPIKYGARPDDAADILQTVCIELFSELSNLRKTESLKSWLISVTAHQAFHWKKKQRPGQVDLDAMQADEPQIQVQDGALLPPELLEEVEQEERVREAIRKLPPRCADMVRLLFYEHPPLPYAEVARRLGLATGSIGFIRGRCLKRLEKVLHDMGF